MSEERGERLRIAVQICAAVTLWLLALLAAVSCAHAPDQRRPIVLPEAIASPVAQLLTEALGMRRINAVALPWLPPFLFREDVPPCIVAHELRHKEQQREVGNVMWLATYKANLALCLAPVALESRDATAVFHCYEANPLEVDAMRVQRECEAREGGGR